MPGQAVDAHARSSSPGTRRARRRPWRCAQSSRRSRSSTRSISGTAYPHDVVTRSTATSMIARRPGSSGNSRRELVELGRAERVHGAACRRCARCAALPLNAHAISVMRPLSRRCAIVSTPLPVRSRYATRVGPRMRSVSRPLGDSSRGRRRRSARWRRRTSAARAHHCARSSEMRREALGHARQYLSAAARDQPIRFPRGRGSWTARAGPTRRGRSPAPRIGPRSRRTRRVSTSVRPAGARAVGRRYWPRVTMSTPTARRSASAAAHLVVGLAHAEDQARLRDEPGVLRPRRAPRASGRSRPTGAPRAAAGRPSRGCG